MENETQVWRPDAPFRQYRTTDAEAYENGRRSGKNWQAVWDHVPGGPWVPITRDAHSYHPDWLEYCKKRARHRELWLKGWHVGLREAAETRPEITSLRAKLILRKLTSA